MNILITGGAGFIGSRLCEKLFDVHNLNYHLTIYKKALNNLDY